MRRALALCFIVAVATPSKAVRSVAGGHGGADLIAAIDGGVVVFDSPGHRLAQRDFPGLISLDLSSKGPLAVLLRHEGEPARPVLELWDYAGDKVTRAPDALAAAARDVIFADGGHALLLLTADQVVVVDLASLTPRRALGVAGLGEAEADLAVSPKDYYLAVATRAGLWLGRTEDLELRRFELPLAATPKVRFRPDGRGYVVAGDGALVTGEIGGLPRRLELDVPASSSFEIGSDGRFAYLADGRQVHMVGLADGRSKYSGFARADQNLARGLAVTSKWGLAAVLYADGQVIWYQPLLRSVASCYPARPGGPAPGGLPAIATAAPERLRAVRDVLAMRVFEQAGEPLDLFLLDRELERLNDLEAVVRDQGWEALVLALTALAAGKPELMPEGFKAHQAALARVDLVELRNVRPRAGLRPGDLVALGPARPTGTERMLSSGRILPVHGFGPFALPLDGTGFPPEATVSLTANLLQGYTLGP